MQSVKKKSHVSQIRICASLVKVDSPQLSVSTTLEVTASVHGQDVVADQDVTLLPGVVVHHTAVVKKVVKHLADIGRGIGAQSINGDVCGLEGGLGSGPRLVISQARLACDGVVLDERKPMELGALKGRCADRPCESLQSLNGEVVGKVLEDKGRCGEKGEAGVRWRRCDGCEQLESIIKMLEFVLLERLKP